MRTTAAVRPLAPILFGALTVGCFKAASHGSVLSPTAAYTQAAAAEIGRLSEAASRAARYDGYADAVSVPIDQQAIVGKALIEYKVAVDVAAHRQGGEPAVFDMAQHRGNADHFRTLVRREMEAAIPGEWTAKCLAKIEELYANGWIICKVGPTEGDVHFGDYSVPAALFTWGSLAHSAWSPHWAHVTRADFRIVGAGTKKRAEATPPAPPTPVPAASTDEGSVEERLLRLKRLREAGALTEDEYQSKRRELLEKL